MATTSNRGAIEESNKDLVRRWFEAVWTDGNDAVAAELVASESAFYDPAGAGTLPATHEAHYEAYRDAFPDLGFAVEDLLAEDDAVAARFTATGTHRGEFLGHAPTGRTFEITGLVFLRIADGRIVETRPVWDVFGLLNQLGLGGGT